MIYVASSWRCARQQDVVKALRWAGQEVYDFKHPAEDTPGFHWSEVMEYEPGSQALVTAAEYRMALDHPRARQGFRLDLDAMYECDSCILVLPCGRSAHLELGWFVGSGKRAAIFLDDPVQPELMYKMVNLVTPDLGELLDWAVAP